jgi:hypothetical protein
VYMSAGRSSDSHAREACKAEENEGQVGCFPCVSIAAAAAVVIVAPNCLVRHRAPLLYVVSTTPDTDVACSVGPSCVVCHRAKELFSDYFTETWPVR